VNACIGVAIAIVVAFAASFIMFGIWAKKGKLDPEETGMSAAVTPGEDGKIFAPIVGEAIALDQVEDEVFSSGAMGPGIAIIPAKGEVYAPCDGTISSFFPTGHAVGITSADGAEILIHVGMDTVKLDGKGFNPQVKEGDVVKKGQLLLKFDIDFIKSQKLPVVTPVIVTNGDDFSTVTPAVAGAVNQNTVLIRYEK
jgi:PTS system beta-glucosides-specific IIC component